jgi:thiosulfate/3-mercaptopyruvate sulfurtransferase
VTGDDPLICASQLKSLLDANTADVVIIEASWATLDHASDYRHGHIPGAIHLDTDDLENGYPRWLLSPPNELHEVIGRCGIASQTTVIVYSARAETAARIWWVLLYAGVADVRLLDGGHAAWVTAGFPSETNINRPHPVVFTARAHADLLATTEDVRRCIGDERTWLADARSAAEYTGYTSGYDYLDRKGRLPGSVHIGDANAAAHIYTHPDGRLRALDDIRTLWQHAAICSTVEPSKFDRDVVFYCGSGWRSSLAFFFAWRMGYRNIRNYSDGFCGWSTRYVPDAHAEGSTPGWRQEPTDNPIVSGDG